MFTEEHCARMARAERQGKAVRDQLKDDRGSCGTGSCRSVWTAAFLCIMGGGESKSDKIYTKGSLQPWRLYRGRGAFWPHGHNLRTGARKNRKKAGF